MKNQLRKRNIRFLLPADMVDAINGIDFKTYAFKNRKLPKYKLESIPVEFKDDCVKFVHQLFKYANHRFGGDYIRWNKSKASGYFEKTYGRYYHNVITCLLKNDIIQCDNSYIAKQENLGYRLSSKFLSKVEEVKTITYKWSYPDKYVNVNPNHFYFINTPLLSNLSNYNNLLKSFTIHICGVKFVSSQKVADYTLLSKKYKYLTIDVEAIYKAAKKDGLIYVAQNSKLALAYVTQDSRTSSAYVPQYCLDFGASCEEVLNSNDFAYLDGDDIEEEYVYRVNDCIVGKEYLIKSENLKAKLLQANYCQSSLILYKGTFYIDNIVSFIERKVSTLNLHYNSVIRNLLDRNYKLNQNDKNNRLDSVFTNMKKTIMDVIKASNDLVEIDLKNSQFAVLANWLKTEGLTKQYQDVKRFYELTKAGQLYETLIGETGMKRDVMKQEMFGIMFSSEKNHTTGKKKIKTLFPNVVEFIDNYKATAKKGYKEFPVELQKREAAIIIDNILYRILGLGLFAITKHDSIIVKHQDKEIIFNIVKTYLNHINFECTVCIEDDCVFIGNANGISIFHNGVSDSLNQDETIPAIDNTPKETGAGNGGIDAHYYEYFEKIKKNYENYKRSGRDLSRNEIIGLEIMSAKFLPAKILLEEIRA